MKFHIIAEKASQAAGSGWAFALASIAVVAWIVGGFFVGFTDTTYQLLINSGTTIVTFLMVFLIQNSANRSAAALHVKVDELLRALADARNDLAGLEDRSEREIREMKQSSDTQTGDRH